MFLILKIAWRNIWRNWRRSVLTILAVIFASFLINVMKGIQIGTYEMNIKNSLEMFTGYLQLQKKGYQDNPTINKSFSLDLELLGALQSNNNIKGFTPRITAYGLLGYKDKAVGAAIFGVDPTRELLYSKLSSKVRKGEFLNSLKPHNIIIGKKMMENLGASIGDSVVILTQSLDGSMGNMKLKIGGVFRFGSNEFDGAAIFAPIATVDELLVMNNKVNSISIFLHNVNDLDIVYNDLNSIVKNKSGSDINVLKWDEVLKEMKQMMDMDIVSGYFYIGILVLIVGFGILNTVLMSITERFREFGVMLALGTKHYIIVTSVFLETLFITITGIIIGSGFGYIINSIIFHNPIKLTGDLNKIYEDIGFIPEIHAAVNIEMFVSTAIILLIVSVLVFIYPAYRMSRLEALKGIRYT